jgi:hypothetical protein
LPVIPKGSKTKVESMKKALGGNQEIPHNGWKAVKLLPNVKRFKVIISNFDVMFAAFGIEKRLPPTLEMKRHSNNKMNRYIKHQFNRIEKHAVSKPLVSWRVGMHLIRKSRVFFVMGLNHVFPKWHREWKLSKVIQLAIQVKRIANTPDTKLIYSRVYIQKEDGSPRPLGVPSPAWRIYLHQINVILSFYFEASGRFHKAQHGFRPGKGTTTAWTEILDKVITSRDIYEFDLKSYFDKVNLDYISDILIKSHVPSNIVQLLYYINTCACIVKEPYKLNEFEHMMKRLIHEKKGIKEVVMHPRPISYMYRVRGVPQGAPTSPALAALALHNSVLDRGMNTIMYADDGMYYGNIDQPIITPNSGIVSANIEFNHKKSGWVKRNGQWLKPLKFLGLIYDGRTNRIRAATRKGSDLIYDKEELVRMIYESKVKPTYEERKRATSWNSWEMMIKSKLIGFIQSRLYQGDWNLDGYEQSFELNDKEGSYTNLYQVRWRQAELITVFNSTTFASEWLVKKLKTMKVYNLL